MPRLNPLICVGSDVSVVPKFLRDTGFLNLVTGVDTNRQGCRFKGTVRDIYTKGGQQFGEIAFDAVPDNTYPLLLTCLKFEGQRPRPQRAPRAPRAIAQQPVDPTDLGDPDLLDDAVEDPTSDDEEPEEEVILDENWEEGDVTVDERIANPRSAFRAVNPILSMNGYAFATPAKYFLHFLPCDHLKLVVLPALNHHASDNVSNWVAVDWPEYLTWLMLWIMMTVISCRDMDIYWRSGDCPYYLSEDFNDYMEKRRFKAILKWHVFCTPNGDL